MAATRPIRTFRWLIQTATPLVRDKLGRRKSALQHHSLALSTFAGDVAQVGTGVHPTHQHHCAWLCIQSKPYRQLWRSTYSSVIHQPLRTRDPIPQLPPLLKVTSFSRRAIRRKMHRAPLVCPTARLSPGSPSTSGPAASRSRRGLGLAQREALATHGGRFRKGDRQMIR